MNTADQMIDTTIRGIAKIGVFSVVMPIKVVASLLWPKNTAKQPNRAPSTSKSRDRIRLLDGSTITRKVRSVNHGKNQIHVITYKKREYAVVKSGKTWRIVA